MGGGYTFTRIIKTHEMFFLLLRWCCFCLTKRIKKLYSIQKRDSKKNATKFLVLLAMERRGWCKPLAPLCNEERWWFATSASLRRFCQWPATYAMCSRRMLLDNPAIQNHYTVAMGNVDSTKAIQNIYVYNSNPKATVERCNQMDRGCICSPNFSDHGAILRAETCPRWPSADAGFDEGNMDVSKNSGFPPNHPF